DGFDIVGSAMLLGRAADFPRTAGRSGTGCFRSRGGSGRSFHSVIAPSSSGDRRPGAWTRSGGRGMSARGGAKRRRERGQVVDAVELDLDTARLAAARAHDPDLALESALHRLGERRQIGVNVRIAR